MVNNLHSFERSELERNSYFHLALNALIADAFRAIGALDRSRQLQISLVKYKSIFDYIEPI